MVAVTQANSARALHTLRLENSCKLRFGAFLHKIVCLTLASASKAKHAVLLAFEVPASQVGHLSVHRVARHI
jgi:hypothetical protein